MPQKRNAFKKMLSFTNENRQLELIFDGLTLPDMLETSLKAAFFANGFMRIKKTSSGLFLRWYCREIHKGFSDLVKSSAVAV